MFLGKWFWELFVENSTNLKSHLEECGFSLSAQALASPCVLSTLDSDSQVSTLQGKILLGSNSPLPLSQSAVQKKKVRKTPNDTKKTHKKHQQ